jgi:hypothetical protein
MLYGIIMAGFAALVYFIRQAGRAAAENEQIKQVLDDIDKANSVRAALDSNPVADERVRDKFTR